MTGSLVARRLAFHVGGYDLQSPEAAHRRFVRELRRFEGAWSVTAEPSRPHLEADEASWRVVTSGPNWRVETEIRLVRWDDFIEAASLAPAWRRVGGGLRAFANFLAAGALGGYLRANWRYAGFFLYPFVMLAVLALLALAAAGLMVEASGSRLAGAAAGALALAGLVRGAGQRLHLLHLLDDWAFSRAYVRGGDPIFGPGLDPRLDRLARELAAAGRGGWDEVVVVGHSLGAVLGIDLVDRALRLDPGLGTSGPRVAFVSVGSSLLKIGLHRGAGRFRAAVGRVASAGGVFWSEYQALTDVMNFYKTEPLSAMGLGGRPPLVRVVRIRRMLEAPAYRRIRRNFFRVHNQFVSGNDRRAPYDYFMLLCGPLAAERQARSPDGAASMIGPDGALLAAALGAEPSVEELDVGAVRRAGAGR